ncbi:MAG TPA: PadR family transcriptional regulator [Longimicrobiales bacterium]
MSNATEHHQPLSPTDYHVLLVLADADQYGYAIMKAIEEESGGVVRPEIGSLYRVLARLMGEGMVEEADAPAEAPDVHRGRPRRYYRLTARGRQVLAAESVRLDQVMALARARNVLADVP